MKTLCTFLCLLACSAFGQGYTLRNLAFVGNVQRVAGAAWTPTDESTLTAWFKADVGVTNSAGNLTTTDGDSVKGWKDNSGHSNHATNTVAGTTYPTYKTSIQNSLPVMRFDGGDEFRADDIYTGYLDGTDTPYIWAMCFRNNRISTAGIWFQGIKSGGTVEFLRAEIDGSNRYFTTRNDGVIAEKNVFVNWDVDTNNFHTVVFVCTGTNAQWFDDGVALGATQDIDVGILENATDIFYIARDLGGVYFRGDIGEIQLYSGAGVMTDVTNLVGKIYTNLQSRWATPIDTPDTCNTTFFTNAVTQNDFSGISANTYFGMFGWDPGVTTNLCSFNTDTLLTVGKQYRASVWTQTGNNLATQQGSGQWSQTITGTGSRKVSKWNFGTSMSVTSGTSYALVISSVTGTLDGSENCYQGGDTTAYSTGQWNGAGVLQASSTRDPKFAAFAP